MNPVWTRPRRGPGQSLDAETAVTGNEEGNHVPRLVVSSHGKRGLVARAFHFFNFYLFARRPWRFIIL